MTPDYQQALERVAEAAERYLLEPSFVTRIALESALDALDRAKTEREWR